MELERELDDLNERLEEQGGATQAQVKKSGFTGVVCVVRGMKGKGEGFLSPPLSPFSSFFFFSFSLQALRSLSSPPPPRSFARAIFRAVFDSSSSFFAPKPNGNACYRG